MKANIYSAIEKMFLLPLGEFGSSDWKIALTKKEWCRCRPLAFGTLHGAWPEGECSAPRNFLQEKIISDQFPGPGRDYFSGLKGQRVFHVAKIYDSLHSHWPSHSTNQPTQQHGHACASLYLGPIQRNSIIWHLQPSSLRTCCVRNSWDLQYLQR